MQAVILAGGRGTRISELSHLLPKPMIEANGKPLIWHIMEHFSNYGVKKFLILAGYKSYKIKEYFSSINLHQQDVVFNYGTNKVSYLGHRTVDWEVTVLDTGTETMTAGRLYLAKKHLDDRFFLTYGDGVSNVNLSALLESHVKNEFAEVTLTAVKPPARFGALGLEENKVIRFDEKSSESVSWINGGFMVAQKKLINRISKPNQVLERDVLPVIAREGKLFCFYHDGYWQPVDTLRDLTQLEFDLTNSSELHTIYTEKENT